MNTHDDWEKIHQNRDWGRYPSEHVIRFVAKNYYNLQRNTVKILDFGCGGEVILGILLKKGLMYTLLTLVKHL